MSPGGQWRVQAEGAAAGAFGCVCVCVRVVFVAFLCQQIGDEHPLGRELGIHSPVADVTIPYAVKDWGRCASVPVIVNFRSRLIGGGRDL